MNNYIKYFACLLVYTLISCKAAAQKFTTHNVKQGERLEQVAKMYGVSVNDILVYNKEVKAGNDLKANTVLVIPQPKSAPTTPTRPSTTTSTDRNTAPGATEISNAQEEPIGFTSHRVRKNETLYGITKRYNISEENLKRYNRELYSRQLDKRMVLRIPKYRKGSDNSGTRLDPNSFEAYTVSPNETRWSIAHSYGITVDSLVALNPDLSKTNNYLREGQELRVPIKAGSTIEEQAIQLYTSYTVPPKMNFYQLEKKFGITSAEIIKLNPEIKTLGGLKEGMVIRVPEPKKDDTAVNTDNFIFYEVKPKQTEYSLTRKFGISYSELLRLNPDLNNGLKAGMVLKLPKDQTGDFEVRNSLVLDKINLIDSITPGINPKILVMLPFRLDRIKGEDKKEMEETIVKRNDVSASLGLYSGALIALDSIADLGVSVNVKTVDNQLSLSKTKELLSKENLAGYSAIIGPLDGSSVQEVAARAAAANVPVIAPIPVNSDFSMPNVFFSYTGQQVLREKMFTYLDSLVIDKNLIVIADTKNEEVAQMIISRFPEVKRATLLEEEENISMNLEDFSLLLSEEKENWVFLETDNEKLVPSVSSILNSSSTEDIKIKMFTTNRNTSFDDDAISVTHLSNLNFTYPSVYREVGNTAFVRRYERRFKSKPDRFAIRGFDLTYDLLLKLAYKNDMFGISKFIGETEYNGNKFSYEKDAASGFYNNAGYIMTYEDMYIKEIKL